MTRDLPVTAAACKLAQAIYYARAEAFGVAVQDWSVVDVTKRHELVDRAVELLEELRPAPRRSFDYMGLVVGAIDPSRPWGDAA